MKRIAAIALLGSCTALAAQMHPASSTEMPAPDATAKRTLRYANPLPVENSMTAADPDVLRSHGTYYMYLSGGLAWSSTNLVDWHYHAMTVPPNIHLAAPAVFESNGYFYLTGNDVGFLRSRSALGPWEYIGDFKDETGKPLKVFDIMVFVDDDAKVYMYFSGRSTKGIYGVQLDPKDFTHFASKPVHFFAFNSSHQWERYGASNSYRTTTWIEAPWMTKRNGKYYLQYSASGTIWKSYAVGVYTGNNPLGPFTYDTKSPILADRKGLINGTGHHCIVEGPDGNLWSFYTVLYKSWHRMRGLERRIGLDPVGFDAQGHMFINGPTETPQWAPGVKSKPWKDNDSGSIPLSIDASYTVSSEGPGHEAPNGFDNSVRTWWEPAEADAQPWLVLDLGEVSAEETPEQFMIDSTRILFAAPAGIRGTSLNTFDPYQYKVEVSADGKNYTTVVDKTKNDIPKTIEFDEIAPVRGRFVRLTLNGWPKGGPPGVLEFTVFGKPIEDGKRAAK